MAEDELERAVASNGANASNVTVIDLCNSSDEDGKEGALEKLASAIDLSESSAYTDEQSPSKSSPIVIINMTSPARSEDANNREAAVKNRLWKKLILKKLAQVQANQTTKTKEEETCTFKGDASVTTPKKKTKEAKTSPRAGTITIPTKANHQMFLLRC